MKIIGLDVGEKRIGVAVADAAVRIAIPDSTVEVSGDEFERIRQIAQSYRTVLFVIGLPRNVAGAETAQSQYVRHFARALQDYIPEAKVKFQDETFTSVEAEQRLKSRKRNYDKSEIDSEAAAIILQDFIENFTSELASSRRAQARNRAVSAQNPNSSAVSAKSPAPGINSAQNPASSATPAKTPSSPRQTPATPPPKSKGLGTALGVASANATRQAVKSSNAKKLLGSQLVTAASVAGATSVTAAAAKTASAAPKPSTPAKPASPATKLPTAAAYATSASRPASATKTASTAPKTRPSRARRAALSVAPASHYVGDLGAPSRASQALNSPHSDATPQNSANSVNSASKKSPTFRNSARPSTAPSSRTNLTPRSPSMVKTHQKSQVSPLVPSSTSVNSKGETTNFHQVSPLNSRPARVATSTNPAISAKTPSHPPLKAPGHALSSSSSPAPVPTQNPATPPSAPSDAKSPQKSSAKSKKSHKIWAVTVFIFLFVVIAIACLCFLGYGWYNDSLTPVSRVPSCQNSSEEACKEIQFTIESGESSKQIADNLEAAGIIKNSLAFQIYLKFENRDNDLKSGTYSLNKTHSVQELVEMLVAGPDKEDSNVFRVTFLPGDTIAKVKQKLIKQGYTKEVVEAAFAKNYDHPVLADKPADASLEGYIYGETYEFYKGESVESIIITALDQLYKVVQDNDLVSAYQAQGLNLYQGITLASIVQKEASASEQPTVAQVFLTRLKQGIALGSDVTTQYALDLVDPDRTTYTDNASALAVDSPYNTRKYTGLPPGPISNPGQSALLAVAHPSNTNYIFFLTGDDGLMYYSNTESEHQQNIIKHCQELCDSQL